MEERIEKHKEMLVSRIDPDFGLLDKLLASEILMREEVQKIKLNINTTCEKNRILLDFILKNKKANELVQALKDSGQYHLENYLNANGVYGCEFGDDWPLNETELRGLDINRESLMDILDTTDLCVRLFSETVINDRQKQFIYSKPTNYEKNESLLDIMTKFSLRQYKKTIACIRDSNQSHIADLLSEGGVLVRIHANLEGTNENVDESEDEIITKLRKVLENRSADEAIRLLDETKLGIIAAKKGHSIVIYIHCKTHDGLLQLIDLLKTNKLNEIVERIFIELLSIEYAMRVRLTWSSEEFKRVSTYFEWVQKRSSEMKRTHDEAKDMETSRQGMGGRLFMYKSSIMGAVMSQNFDAAFFNKYATREYYLSKGASGNVYGPIQWNDMQLAIKQTTFAAGKFTEELKKEIEAKKDIMASIEHEHLLKIHFVDLNQLPKSVLIVMEFAAGGSLHDALRSLGVSGQKLPIDAVTNWAKQIAEGMLYLHEKNIVHRNLKSSNILLMEPFDICKHRTKMTLKIADFDEVRDYDHTMTMTLVGTVAYMAPEVITEQRFSKGSDVWSYGVMIWEMLTGDPPRKELEPNTIIHKTIKGELDSLKKEESFPSFLKQLLIRCLEPILMQRASFLDVVSIIQVLTRQRLLNTIKGLGMIHGLAVYEDQLFVLTCRPNRILVYNCTNFTLNREISIDKVESPQCMDICASNKCLYISDFVSRSVYKLPVSDERRMTSWEVSDKPRGISVNRDTNVLVIIERKKCIEEYTPSGEMVRRIPHREIARPWHCVQLDTGKYVVCHGSGPTDQHRVCLIDPTDRVIGLYGSQPGGENNQLNWPNYLALDSRNNIAVSDRENKRIQLLDSSLTWFATISQLPNGRSFSKLRALCIDDVRGRLYVGQFNGMVHILTYSIKPAT